MSFALDNRYLAVEHPQMSLKQKSGRNILLAKRHLEVGKGYALHQTCCP
jgi:hypothetical protein